MLIFLESQRRLSVFGTRDALILFAERPEPMLLKKRFNLICGHYGVGKTNLALNLALEAADAGQKVVLADMDLVNPYFRSSDYANLLDRGNIRVVAPVYANSNVDVPSLPAELYGIFDSGEVVIMDVGGDDVGATVLGRFQSQINALDYDMFYVINAYRNLTAVPEEAAGILKEIERVSRCRATAVINNSHLKSETTEKTVLDSLGFARATAELLQLPLIATTAPKNLAESLGQMLKEEKESVYPVDILVKTIWEV